jgi:tetratricopeptide (TPR) repeat protein
MPKRLITALALAAALAAPSQAADTAALAAAKQQLQAGVSASQADAIMKARSAFALLQQQNPKDARLACWIAVACWRAVPLLQTSDAEQAKRVCKDGIAAADRAIALDPKLADAVAVKAGLQGLSLSFNPSMSMTLGPEMDESYGRAEGMEPGNPRVAFLKALNTMHKPEFVGGGAKRAMAQFERSIALFAAQKAGDARGFDWGRADAELWAGRCQLKLGDTTAAKAHYHKALEIDPANLWVAKVLLPALEPAAEGTSEQ